MRPARPAVRLASPWTEAVFHVLAHVDVGPVAASCHDPGYVGGVAARLGSAGARTLGEDARVLAAALASHERLARAQLLAWLWRDETEAGAATASDLRDLDASDVADPAALEVVQALGAPAEVLRASAELELPGLRALGPVDAGPALDEALAAVAAAAPWLDRMEIAMVRALPRRGRARSPSILVGAPGTAGAELAHAAWQAAHEATVVEVERSLSQDARTFEAVERAALGLLRERAARAGLAGPHGRWLATLDLTALDPAVEATSPRSDTPRGPGGSGAPRPR
jgi:hypothetical protein